MATADAVADAMAAAMATAMVSHRSVGLERGVLGGYQGM